MELITLIQMKMDHYSTFNIVKEGKKACDYF